MAGTAPHTCTMETVVVDEAGRVAYWTRHLDGVPTLQLPTDYPRPPSHKARLGAPTPSARRRARARRTLGVGKRGRDGERGRDVRRRVGRAGEDLAESIERRKKKTRMKRVKA